jgi:RNA polymerase sigma factor (sigma-70 family)
MQMRELGDHDLWLLIRDGHSLAYKELYSRYFDILFAAIIKRVKVREEAEDIIQDVFLTIWEKRLTMRIDGKIFPYFFSIMRYKVIHHLKQRTLSDKHEDAWRVAGEGFTQLTDAEKTDREMLLEREAGQLPKQLRKVYSLSIDAGMSVTDVAHQLDLSHHTVKNHLKEIRKRFRSAAGKMASVLFSLLLFFLPMLTKH